jgi:hypothetical protein
MTKTLVIAMSICLFASPAINAQVWKCKSDATGKIEYSGTPCDTRRTGKMVNTAPNEVDASGSRQAAEQMRARKIHDEAMMQDARATAAAESGPGGRTASEGACGDVEGEYQRAKSKRAPPETMQSLKNRVRIACSRDPVGSSPRTMAASGGASAARPSMITNCDAGGCWDNLGGRYNMGAGTTYIPSSGGAACQLIGGQMQCP